MKVVADGDSGHAEPLDEFLVNEILCAGCGARGVEIQYHRAVEPARMAGVDVKFGGIVAMILNQPKGGPQEGIGILLALVVLLLAFGSFLAAGIPILVSRSGFTAWGVELARKANLTLIGRARGKRFIALAGQDRIVFDQDLAYVEEESGKHRRKAAVHDD